MTEYMLVKIVSPDQLIDLIKNEVLVFYIDKTKEEKIFNKLLYSVDTGDDLIMSISDTVVKLQYELYNNNTHKLDLYYKVSISKPLKTTDLVVSNTEEEEKKLVENKKDTVYTLYYFVGRSGSGKDYTVKKLIEKLKQEGLEDKFKPLVPITTRPIRDGEVDGEDYIFYPTLKDMTLHEDLYEIRHYEVGDGSIWSYGSSLSGLNDTDSVYYTIGTIESAKSLVEYVTKHDRYKMVIKFVMIDSDDRTILKNIIDRNTESVDEVIRRFTSDKEMLTSNPDWYNDLCMSIINSYKIIMDYTTIYNDKGNVYDDGCTFVFNRIKKDIMSE